MNGLTLLGLILGGLLAWWAAWALVYGGTQGKYPPPPEVQRRMDKWGDR